LYLVANAIGILSVPDFVEKIHVYLELWKMKNIAKWVIWGGGTQFSWT